MKVYLKNTFVIAAVMALMLVAIEGVASYALLLYDIATTSQIAERKHTKYDPELGWVNEPGVVIPDAYGNGAYLKVNGQGFRNDEEFSISVPKGKIRIICSGDSFTLGWGVDNDHVWCERLRSFDPRLETVNMGQGGYGVDQVYLWYKRDGSKFGHQVQLLAFITEDFRRMALDSFMGYGKPVLKERADVLSITNVPVPIQSYNFPWLTTNLENFNRIRTLQLLHKIVGKMRLLPQAAAQSSESLTTEEVQKVLRVIFKNLVQLNRDHASRLVLVYFPTLNELVGEAPVEWIEFLERESQSQGIALISLFEDFRSLSQKELAGMYRIDGHFTEEGNEFVARVLYTKLSDHKKLPDLVSVGNYRQ